MSIQVKIVESSANPDWDLYVQNHQHSNLYHTSGWKKVIEKTYGHKTYYLIAAQSSKLIAHSSKPEDGSYVNSDNDESSVRQ